MTMVKILQELRAFQLRTLFSMNSIPFFSGHAIFGMGGLFSRANNEDKNLSFTTGEVLRDNQMKLTSVD